MHPIETAGDPDPRVADELEALRQAPLGSAPADVLARVVGRVLHDEAQSSVPVAAFGSSI